MKTTLFPDWKELAHLIADDVQNQRQNFYSDEDIAIILGEMPGTNAFAYQWMQCRNMLLRKHGIDFIRVKNPVRGYKVMTDSEKVKYGFQRRMNKTRRNAKRMMQVTASVNRQQLSSDDARAHDMNIAKAGLLSVVFSKLPKGVKNLRLTVDLERDMPKLQ